MAISEDAKKSGIIKPIIIILLAFLMVPTLTVAIAYYVDEGFKYKTNEVLSAHLPGRLGTQFAKQPTKEELQQLKLHIAKQYIKYEDDRLADKLQIIKAEDQQLYNDLVILLSRENSSKMSRVREIIRNAELKSDLLQRIIADLDLEQETVADELVSYYTSLLTSDAVNEIERSFDSGELTLELLPLIFNKLPVDQSALYLQYINDDLQQKIKFRLTPSKRTEIEKRIEGNKIKNQQLVELAEVYKESQLEELVEELGSNNKFNHRDLARIYQNLPVTKTGQVLARVEDQEFILRLYEAINELEKLNATTSGLTNKLAAAVQIYQSYEEKLEELALAYQRMPISELTTIVNQMLSGNPVYQRHNLGQGVEIVFTQEQLVVDILRRFRPNQVANLLESLDTSKAVDLSKKLVTN
ncbi:hypothetical protein [Alkaliphilus transvaalensis]|uniref:hypothetical protein n=1 Tax=Alkaliphilus transvaalensis TaxID=114628 RepID=UPI0004797098|nr:hypothetical protein [Alkaliphilus transvaalensis]